MAKQFRYQQRTFNGRRYYLTNQYYLKRDADQKADSLKRRGLLVRIVRSKTKLGMLYKIYSRSRLGGKG